MVRCIVPGCKSSFYNTEAVQYFRIPTDQAQRDWWLKLIGPIPRPITDSSRVCSDHFYNGDKSNGPTLVVPAGEKAEDTAGRKAQSRSEEASPVTLDPGGVVSLYVEEGGKRRLLRFNTSDSKRLPVRVGSKNLAVNETATERPTTAAYKSVESVKVVGFSITDKGVTVLDKLPTTPTKVSSSRVKTATVPFSLVSPGGLGRGDVPSPAVKHPPRPQMKRVQIFHPADGSIDSHVITLPGSASSKDGENPTSGAPKQTLSSPSGQTIVMVGTAAKNRVPAPTPEPPSVSEVAASISLVEMSGTQKPSLSRKDIAFSPLVAQAMIDSLEQDNVKLKKLVGYRQGRLTIEDIKDKDEMVQFVTGLPNYHIFLLLHDLCMKFRIRYFYLWAVTHLKTEDQLLLVLIKLRLNVDSTYLALRFSVSGAVVRNVVCTWICALRQVLVKEFMKDIPSLKKNLATPVAQSIDHLRSSRIIIGIVEINNELSYLMPKNSISYMSVDNNKNTPLKGLIGVSPSGTIIYVSDLYISSTSDLDVVRDCGVLEKLSPGDAVTTDATFSLQGVPLPRDVTWRTCPRGRAHILRALSLARGYTILHKLPFGHRTLFNEIFQVCFGLANLLKPLAAGRPRDPTKPKTKRMRKRKSEQDEGAAAVAVLLASPFAVEEDQ